MARSERELRDMLRLAREEIQAWRNGLNHRNMNKCKVGATFVNMRELEHLLQGKPCDVGLFADHSQLDMQDRKDIKPTKPAGWYLKGKPSIPD